MAFRYCAACRGPLEAPTAEFDLNIHGARVCPHCGSDPGQHRSLEEWVADVDTRLRDLEGFDLLGKIKKISSILYRHRNSIRRS